MDVVYYHFLSSWKFILEGDMPSAVRYAEIATKAAEGIGTPFPIGICQYFEALALFELGKTGEAEARINLARQIGRRLKSKQIGFMCLIADAQFALDIRVIEEKKRGHDALRRAMELGREQGYVNMVGWRNEVMSRLCVNALEAGIEVEYAKSLVRKRNLIPDAPPIQCEDWPWPIKIFTLGRFVILHEDKPMQSAGKIQHKPLEMLRVILSHRDGEVSESRLINVLWPDTEGDTAYHAYEVALHRLRRLLGADGAVRRQGRQVSLDKRYCWVDAWAFETATESLQAIHELPQQSTTAEDVRAAVKAINIYKGHFLPEDAGREWTAATRLRLQNKFRDVAASLGDYLEQTGQWKKAAAHYQKAIEVDGLAEAFYQRLMICYQHLGQRAQGIEVYRHLKNTLFDALRITPSPETETIHQSLLGKSNKP